MHNNLTFPSSAPKDFDEKYLVLLFLYFFTVYNIFISIDFKWGIFMMDYTFGYFNFLMGSYFIFLIVFGLSILMLIWVTIIYLVKKIRRLDR